MAFGHLQLVQSHCKLSPETCKSSEIVANRLHTWETKIGLDRKIQLQHVHPTATCNVVTCNFDISSQFAEILNDLQVTLKQFPVTQDNSQVFGGNFQSSQAIFMCVLSISTGGLFVYFWPFQKSKFQNFGLFLYFCLLQTSKFQNLLQPWWPIYQFLFISSTYSKWPTLVDYLSLFGNFRQVDFKFSPTMLHYLPISSRFRQVNLKTFSNHGPFLAISEK